ncbi:hypothetical protein D6C78_02060 [Aureobasidium pullulans]|uniref:Uncharacterized protein n=1 Tax=Aureobasidium pullulans TaxID=5580 RepID=A0A4T0C116_AURPU|nr:hypothetical protein D6C78_02060 [Aureobasidium pullulans]
MALSGKPIHFGSLDLPSPTRQLSYFSTGCLAGFASLPMAFLPKIPSITAASPLVLRAGVRFWTFDHIRHILAPLHLPVWLTGGLGGAAGGFNEVLIHSMVQSRKLPPVAAIGSQTLRLFFCFGTYTFLSTTFVNKKSIILVSSNTSPCAELCHAHAVEKHNVSRSVQPSTESVTGRNSLRAAGPMLKTLCISTVQTALGVAVRWLDVTDLSTWGGMLEEPKKE